MSRWTIGITCTLSFSVFPACSGSGSRGLRVLLRVVAGSLGMLGRPADLAFEECESFVWSCSQMWPCEPWEEQDLSPDGTLVAGTGTRTLPSFLGVPKELEGRTQTLFLEVTRRTCDGSITRRLYPEDVVIGLRRFSERLSL